MPISIHASRMGCDRRRCIQRPCTRYFNPRIPYGMRLDSPPLVLRAGVFQSTHPVWDATISEAAILLAGQISIHASRMGCDMLSRARSARTRHFNPRIPYGMRQKVRRLPAESKQFQYTHPVWDATTMRRLSRRCSEFQSTHPVWDATRAPSGKAFQAAISIHASRMGCDLSPE